MANRLLDRERAALVVVDVQEAFRPAVLDFERVARNTAVLVEGAKALGVPVVATEQYPEGLGKTVPEVAEHLSEEPLDKVRFSAAEAERFSLDGREVHVAQDATTSRTQENREVGLRRMEREGAVVTSVEAALFELLGAAGSEEFKTVQRLIK